MLTSAISNIGVEYNVTMTSTPNILTTDLRDLLNNHCIDHTCYYSICTYPKGRISVCKIRFISTGKNCRKLCLVCRKIASRMFIKKKCVKYVQQIWFVCMYSDIVLHPNRAIRFDCTIRRRAPINFPSQQMHETFRPSLRRFPILAVKLPRVVCVVSCDPMIRAHPDRTINPYLPSDIFHPY